MPLSIWWLYRIRPEHDADLVEIKNQIIVQLEEYGPAPNSAGTYKGVVEKGKGGKGEARSFGDGGKGEAGAFPDWSTVWLDRWEGVGGNKEREGLALKARYDAERDTVERERLRGAYKALKRRERIYDWYVPSLSPWRVFIIGPIYINAREGGSGYDYSIPLRVREQLWES